MFGGTGFLGLGGTGFGDFVSNVSFDIEKGLEQTTDFISKLPSEIIEIGEGLGQRIFGVGSSPTAQRFEQEGREFQQSRIGSQAGDLIGGNIEKILLFGGLGIAVFFLSGK